MFRWHYRPNQNIIPYSWLKHPMFWKMYSAHKCPLVNYIYTPPYLFLKNDFVFLQIWEFSKYSLLKFEMCINKMSSPLFIHRTVWSCIYCRASRYTVRISSTSVPLNGLVWDGTMAEGLRLLMKSKLLYQAFASRKAAPLNVYTAGNAS